MRHVSSSGVDVYSAIGASAAALYGPKHGGANEAVLRMLEKIGTVDKIPQFVEQVKAKKALLMGFGHRVYRNYDPRARIIKKVAEEVFAVLGKEPLIEVAVALEKFALEDPYFIERKLYPNVDFYSGLIYKCMGFPTDYFPVLFSIPRTVGWLAHWSVFGCAPDTVACVMMLIVLLSRACPALVHRLEFQDDPENKIVRPRQVYLGSGVRDYVPIEQRTAATTKSIVSDVSAVDKRRSAATFTRP